MLPSKRPSWLTLRPSQWPANAIRAPRGRQFQANPSAAVPAGADPVASDARLPKRTAADAVHSPQPVRPQAGRGGGGSARPGGSNAANPARRKGLMAQYGSADALAAAADGLRNPPPDLVAPMDADDNGAAGHGPAAEEEFLDEEQLGLL